jgi:hypothetical protein
LSHNTYAQIHIALGDAMVEPDPPPLNVFATSSWLQASQVYVAAQAAGLEGKGKTFGIPILKGFSSVKGLMLSMDKGKGQGPPGIPSTMPEELDSIAGTSQSSGSVMEKGKGQGSGHPIPKSWDIHDGKGKGKGIGRSKGKEPRVVDEDFLAWLEASGRGKGKGCDAAIIVDIDESYLSSLEEAGLLSTDDVEASAKDQT